MSARRRSRSCSGGDCVWVEPLPGGQVLVSDRQHGGNELIFDSEEWAEFIAGAKAGEFDPEALR